MRLAHEHIEKRKKQGQSYENAANATAIELVQCAEAHCRAFLVSSAYETTKDINKKLSPELSATIQQLIELYAIDTCMKSLGDLLRVCIFFSRFDFFHFIQSIFMNQTINSFSTSNFSILVYNIIGSECTAITTKIGGFIGENSAKCRWHR